MENPTKQDITIIGCGVAGCVMALLLANKGFKVSLYERSSRQEICNIASKRSYNLTFFTYGIELMKSIGLWDVVEPHLILLNGSTTQITKDSKPIFSPVNNKDSHYFAISRSRLLQVILEKV